MSPNSFKKMSPKLEEKFELELYICFQQQCKVFDVRKCLFFLSLAIMRLKTIQGQNSHKHQNWWGKQCRKALHGSRKEQCSENKDQVSREAERPSKEMLKGLRSWGQLENHENYPQPQSPEPGRNYLKKWSKKEWGMQKAKTSTDVDFLESQSQEGV